MSEQRAKIYTQRQSQQISYLFAKKKQYIDQILQLDQKSKQITKILSSQIEQLGKEKEMLSNQLKELNKQLRDKREQNEQQSKRHNKLINKYQQQLQGYKRIIESKEQMFNQNLEKLIIKQKSSVQLEIKKIQLQSQINRIRRQYQTSIQQITEKNNRNIQTIIAKYQTVISEKVGQIQNQYKVQLQKINSNNKALIQQLQQKEKYNSEATKLKLKQNISNQERLVSQNNKLLQNNNEYKRKIINLQSTIQTKQQELKIVIRQKQIIGVNFKRQIQCMKENKVQLQNKIKRLIQLTEDNKWEIKQIQIEKQKQIQKINKNNEKAMDQLLETYRNQVSEYKLKIRQLSDQKQSLVKKRDELKREKDSAKQIIEFLKKQKQTWATQQKIDQRKKNQQQIDQQTENYKLKSLTSELKKQILRKNAEIQVLKQQISRLRTKVNKITVAYQENIKSQQIMQKQNKMLLSQIVFLRDKNKSKFISNKKNDKENMNSRENSRILDMKSEHSQIVENQNQNQLEMYKQLIVQMEKDMNQAVAKLDEKNNIIQKQKAIIQRLQRALNK